MVMQSRTINTHRALTWIELLVVIALVALLAGLFLRESRPRRSHTKRIPCLRNLKELGLAYRQFAFDQDGKFPWLVSVTNGGSGSNAWTNAGYAYRHFLVISNELGNSTRALLCPADRNRLNVPGSFETILTGKVDPTSKFDPKLQFNRAVSYFIGLDATEENPLSILGGDRNLSLDVTARSPVRLGSTGSEKPWSPATNYFVDPKLATFGFDRAIHGEAGNLLMGDGSVQQVLSNSGLPKYFQEAGRTEGFTRGFLFPNNPGQP